MLDRVVLQHMQRMSVLRLATPYHVRHEMLLSDMVALAVSTYAKVRTAAQASLGSALVVFAVVRRRANGNEL